MAKNGRKWPENGILDRIYRIFRIKCPLRNPESAKGETLCLTATDGFRHSFDVFGPVVYDQRLIPVDVGFMSEENV